MGPTRPNFIDVCQQLAKYRANSAQLDRCWSRGNHSPTASLDPGFDRADCDRQSSMRFALHSEKRCRPRSGTILEPRNVPHASLPTTPRGASPTTRGCLAQVWGGLPSWRGRTFRYGRGQLDDLQTKAMQPRSREWGSFDCLSRHAPQGSDLDEESCLRLDLWRGSRLCVARGLHEMGSGPLRSASSPNIKPEARIFTQIRASSAHFGGSSKRPLLRTFGWRFRTFVKRPIKTV